ncbi:unnamed protein product [Didymodactylos carnosus]|uniref:Proteasome subunit beta type-4 n=1 Tax=Didymodactylos carnosus TaxID=1234261 RepID=A0A813QG38_9BILA|nr:unnamed protein product [Didymodactylos carnosus]CAF0767060.1 unnamed protein product [Didymodactylos carnosus]CAF3492805.1 unnamed protein product [Didymodactylos carnosus]CAF3548656.1 unnamed protein product [Didymodactylos carnosus]
MLGSHNSFSSFTNNIHDSEQRQNFGVSLETEAERGIRTRTVNPVVTGSSVTAFTFNGGVILAADTLGSYGTLAKYRNIPRIHQVNDKTVIAIGGDLSDADYIKEAIDAKVEEDLVQDANNELSPLSLYSWCTRLMYHRRTKLNPLLTNVIVAGMENKEPFLGRVNDKGSAFKEFIIMTGIGNHLAQVIIIGWIRTILENSNRLNRDEAENLMDRIVKQLFYRDCRAFARYQVCVVTDAGIDFKAKEVTPDWSLAPTLERIPYVHRFGIISGSCKEKIEQDIIKRQTDRSDSSDNNVSDRSQNKKQPLLEVTEDFVRYYNRANYSERIKLNDLVYRMLQRLKRKSTQYQPSQSRPLQLQMAWAELCLLAQCKSTYQEECLTILYKSLLLSPLSSAQIPTLFFLSETILYWLKNEAILEQFLTATELKLLKIGQLVFQLLYFHYLEGSTSAYEEFKYRLYSYLEGLEECESVYSSYPNAVWCIRYIESVGSILVATIGKRLTLRSQLQQTQMEIKDLSGIEIASPTRSKSVISSIVQELSPIIWHSVDLWLCVKKMTSTTNSDHYYNESILSLVQCPESFSQLPLQKRADDYLMATGWRSWKIELILLLCECLMNICIDTDISNIKRCVLFGDEMSVDNILNMINSENENGGDRLGVKSASALLLFFPPEDDSENSWRVRYMSLLCLSQIYRHLKNDSRHKTLNNLLWCSIHEHEGKENDDRVLEALKVGQFDENTQNLTITSTPRNIETIYTSIAKRLADGLLPDPSPEIITQKQSQATNYKPPVIHHNMRGNMQQHRLSLPSIPQSSTSQNKVKKISIEQTIDSVFKRKNDLLKSIVVEQFRRELKNKEENDIVNNLETMLEKAAIESNTLTVGDENLTSRILNVANKKFIVDPLEERKALRTSFGEIDENNNE